MLDFFVVLCICRKEIIPSKITEEKKMQKTLVRNASVSIILLVAILAVMTISLLHTAMSRISETNVGIDRLQNAVVMTDDRFSGESFAE